MRKEGDRLIIEPVPPASFLAVLAALTRLTRIFHRSKTPHRSRSRSDAYLLDTDIVSDLVRSPQGQIAKRIAEVSETEVCKSSFRPVQSAGRCVANLHRERRLFRL